jgi:hypothetical protein
VNCVVVAAVDVYGLQVDMVHHPLVLAPIHALLVAT